MEHQEIRFRILSTLYQKHYSEQLGHPQDTEKIIQEAGLNNINKNDVNGDVVYLEDKRLITATKLLGHDYPPSISITSYGIDFVENVVNNLLCRWMASTLTVKLKWRSRKSQKKIVQVQK